MLDIAVNHRTAQRACPEMFDLQLRLAHRDRTRIKQGGHFALLCGEQVSACILQRAYRDNGQARINLDAGNGIARRSAKERLFEVGMRDAFRRAGKARAQLHARRPHFQIRRDHLSPADAASHKHRHLLCHMRQNFLREHAGRHRADMAASLHPLNHQRVNARSDQLFGQAERGRKTDHLRAASLNGIQRARRGQPACQHDMRYVMARADRDQIK